MKLWLSYATPAPEGYHWAHSVEEAKETLRSREVTELSMEHRLGNPACTGQCFTHHDPEFGQMICGKEPAEGKRPPRCWCPCHRLYPTGSDLALWMGDNDLFPALIEVRERNVLRWLVLQKLFKKYLMRRTTVVRVTHVP